MQEARERFRECWEILDRALGGEPFTYAGRFLQVEKEIRIRPRPRRERVTLLRGDRHRAERAAHGGARHAADLHLDR